MKSFFLPILLFLLGFGGYYALTHPSMLSGSLTSSLTSSLMAIKPAAPTPPEKVWTPPAIIPAQPNWTWTTTDGKVYHNVKIVRVDAACITITHADGGGRVPLSTLSPDMQKYFNYDPAAAAKADQDFDSGVKAEQDIAAKEAQDSAAQATNTVAVEPDTYRVTDDYATAVTQAKAANKLLLLHFTGSDWCPACKMMEEQIISTTTFQAFAAANFVVVTLDDPHGFQLSSDLQQQTSSLSQKYHINAVPTLVVTDLDGTELARTEGCPDQPSLLIADLKHQLAK